MKSCQQFLTSIAGEIQRFKRIMEGYLPDLEEEIGVIIAIRSEDEQRIERLLDTLLDLQSLGVGKSQFIQLLEYYKQVNPEAAADYWAIYEEVSA